MTDFETFLRWEAKSRDTIDFKKAYVDMAGDVVAGLMLSQIVFWHLPDRTGAEKLRVERDGCRWLVKSRDEWWEECRLSPREVDRARKALEGLGIIQVKLYKFNGSPTQHIRIDEGRFLELWTSVVEGRNVRAKRKFSRGGGSGEGGLSHVETSPGECPPAVIDQRLGGNPLIIPISPISEIHFPKQGDGFHRNGKMDFTNQGKPRTEITTEITTETTAAAREATPTARAGGLDAAAVKALVQDLVSQGVSRAAANRYALEKPDVCRRCLDYLPYAKFKTTKGAWLANAIRDEYGPPVGYEVAKAREMREADQKARQSHEDARRRAKRESLKATYLAIEEERSDQLRAFNAYVERERAQVTRVVAHLSVARRDQHLAAFDALEYRLDLFERWLSAVGTDPPERGQGADLAFLGPSNTGAMP